MRRSFKRGKDLLIGKLGSPSSPGFDSGDSFFAASQPFCKSRTHLVWYKKFLRFQLFTFRSRAVFQSSFFVSLHVPIRMEGGGQLRVFYFTRNVPYKQRPHILSKSQIGANEKIGAQSLDCLRDAVKRAFFTCLDI